MTRSFRLFATTLIAVALLSSCQGTTADESDAASSPAAESDAQVEYEPAYPTDVSAEGLSEDDVSQHEAAHSHGEEEHTHGEDSHTHDEDEGDDGHQH